MSEYRDEKNNLYRIVQITPPEDSQREERERQTVEELYAIFERKPASKTAERRGGTVWP